jgi:hypothetical protein
MAIITTSLAGVKLGMVESDIAGLRQKLTEAKAAVNSHVAELGNLGTRYKDLIDTFGQAGYAATNADCAVKKAQWDALVAEFSTLNTQATALKAAMDAVVAGF